MLPGTMIAAVATGLGSLDVPIPATAGMVGTSWRFLHPVRPGDSLHTVWRLNRKRPVENPRHGLCFWQIEVLNQHGTVVATGEVGRLVQRRHPAEPDGHAAHPEPEAGEPATAARSRRRRGRRPATDKERVSEVIESAPVPEPANADVPGPSRRRRRRRGPGNHGGGQAEERAAPEPAAPAEPAPARAEPAPARARPARGLSGVLRRLRGS